MGGGYNLLYIKKSHLSLANVFPEGSRYSGTNLFVFRQCCDTEGRIVLKSHTKGQSDIQIFEQ